VLFLKKFERYDFFSLVKSVLVDGNLIVEIAIAYWPTQQTMMMLR